jgi:hypothetical protein
VTQEGHIGGDNAQVIPSQRRAEGDRIKGARVVGYHDQRAVRGDLFLPLRADAPDKPAVRQPARSGWKAFTSNDAVGFSEGFGETQKRAADDTGGQRF